MHIDKVVRGPLQAQRQKKKKSPRRQFEDGQRRAVVRAFTAAALRLNIPISVRSQADAAEMCGANRSYVDAATTLLESRDVALIDAALLGHMTLREAAKAVRKKVELVRAFSRASAEDRRALGATFGPDRVFDEVIVPSLNR